MTKSHPEDLKNPAYYCFDCDKYLGHRGFCSQKCHDEFYDKNYEANNG